MDNVDPDYTPDPPSPDEKLCRKCGKWKDKKEFFTRGKNSKYLAGYCKECHTKPFHHEKIVCPHCKNKIVFYGVDHKDNIVHNNSQIIAKLKKELKSKGKRKKKAVEKEKSEMVFPKSKTNLRDIFE